LPVGNLASVREGAREYSAFAYGQDWLRHPARFAVSPDLALGPGHQVRKRISKEDSCFFLAMAGSAARVTRVGWFLRKTKRRSQRITLAPPLARAVAPVSWALALLLEGLRLFNSHYLVGIRR